MEKEKNENDESNYISLLITLIALISPAAYIIGLAYHQGSLNGYGIDSSNFEYSIYDIYTSFYGVISQLFSYVLIHFIKLFNLTNLIYFSLFFITLSSIIFFTIKLANKENLISDDSKIKKIISIFNPKKNDYVKAAHMAGLLSYFLFIAIYVLLLFSLLWCLTPYYAYKAGEDIAHEKLNNFIVHGCINMNSDYWNDCVNIYDAKNKSILSGLFIIRDQHQIAIFDGRKVVILKLPDNYVISKSMTNNVTKI